MRFECSLEEYKKYKLGELVENVVAGATPKTSVDDYWNGGDIPWLSSGEVHKKFIYFTDKFITSEGYNNSSTKIVPTNSVLIALAGQGKTRGTVAINKIELCTNQSIASIIPNEMLNYKYLFYYLESKYEYLRALSSSDGGRGGLNLKLIRSIPIQVPSIKEQENISNFINEIDKKILLLEQKHKLYDDFKKYLMQQIFTQKLRFENYNEAIYKLSDLYSSKKGTGLSKDKLDEEGLNKCILYGELYTTYNEIIQDVKSKTNSQEGILSKVGDILIPSSTTTKGIDLVTASVILEENVLLSGDITILRSKNENIINNKFFAYYFTNNLVKDVSKLTQGSTIIHLYWKDFKKVKLALPPINEQNKCVDLFLKLDKKIDLINFQIQKMEEFKKGLLQQMFVVRINWRCNFKLVKSPSFNKHLLILKNKIIFIIIK